MYGNSLRILVCGGRNYQDKDRVNKILDDLHNSHGIGLMICGGAKGADTIAKDWALFRGITCIEVLPNWDKYGKAAGPIRNKKMLDDYCPHYVIAFPGGKGTENMIEQAENNNFKVFKVT